MIQAFAMPLLAGFAASAVKTVASVVGDAVTKPADEPRLEKARATAKEFETMFLEDMLGRVFETTGGEGPLGENGMGGDIYKSMLVKEFAKSISQAGGIGLAKEVYGELLKLQEEPDAASL